MAQRWVKSSYSGSNGDCVEVASRPAAVLVRDSKAPAEPWLTIPASRWRRFLASVADGRFDG